MDRLQILYEDNHLLAINKPAGLPTMGAPAGEPTLVSAAKTYLKRQYNKPGEVYLGVVSRLDSPVTGVVLFARTSKAAARLTASFRERRVGKRYWALVWPMRLANQGSLTHYLHKDEQRRRMVICSPDHPSATEAQLKYRQRAELSGSTWLELELITGRKHQIRVQLSAARSPILGDRKYGSQHQFACGIALHSWQLRLEHPVRREPLEIQAPAPSYWPREVRNEQPGS